MLLANKVLDWSGPQHHKNKYVKTNSTHLLEEVCVLCKNKNKFEAQKHTHAHVVYFDKLSGAADIFSSFQLFFFFFIRKYLKKCILSSNSLKLINPQTLVNFQRGTQFCLFWFNFWHYFVIFTHFLWYFQFCETKKIVIKNFKLFHLSKILNYQVSAVFIRVEINHDLSKHNCDRIRTLHYMNWRIFSTGGEIGINCLELTFSSNYV